MITPKHFASKLAFGAVLVLMSILPSSGAPLETTSASFRLEGRQVMAWYPSGVDRRLPLVLFSHGYRGGNIQSRTLMRSLAAAGYLVLAPNHKDAARWLGGEGRAGASFGTPDNWTDSSYKDRFEDMLAVYRAIPKDPKLSSLYQGGPVILAGHSLGGYTALGMAGARPGWSSEIKPAAVLALSPYCAPYLRSGALSHVQVPVMYQGGTLDSGITPAVSRPGGAYDQTPGPKVFVNFEGAGHVAWTELRQEFQSQIAEYAVAFCNRFAKDGSTEVLTKELPAVADLRTSGL